MKKTLLRFAFVIAACAAATLNQACQSRGTVTPAEESVAGPIGTSTVVPSSSIAALRYTISAEPESPEFAGLSEQVAAEAGGVLNAQGFRVARSDPDLAIHIRTGAEEFDRSGNYYRYKGIANTSITRIYDRRTVAARTFEIDGTRTLGQDRALRVLGNELADHTADWIRENATSTAIGLAASDVTVTLAWDQRYQISEYAAMFVRTVGALDGIANVIATHQDTDARQITFRIVYFPDEFPEGLVNHLAEIWELRFSIF